MTQMRLSEAAEMLGVSADTVRRWAAAGRLGSTRTPSGRWLVDAEDAARLARREPARPPRLTPQSTRNRFAGVVVRVVKDRVAAQVEIQAGPHRFVALVTSEAVDELGLEPGMPAFAAVKATSVFVELPES
ncbi:MAG TPA: helix-turn-helix transcriptional regulator [Candidatus Dormibacteraeota bacterium]|nr:helix-turn-helix transcriptional regulator [Candidatus Dormibacteraeota bacterium]